jgi:type IV secretory pathway TrbL component
MLKNYRPKEIQHAPTKNFLIAFNILAWVLVVVFLLLSILAYSVNYPSWYLLVALTIILCPLNPGHPLLKVFLGGIVLALL